MPWEFTGHAGLARPAGPSRIPHYFGPARGGRPLRRCRNGRHYRSGGSALRPLSRGVIEPRPWVVDEGRVGGAFAPARAPEAELIRTLPKFLIVGTLVLAAAVIIPLLRAKRVFAPHSPLAFGNSAPRPSLRRRLNGRRGLNPREAAAPRAD